MQGQRTETLLFRLTSLCCASLQTKLVSSLNFSLKEEIFVYKVGFVGEFETKIVNSESGLFLLCKTNGFYLPTVKATSTFLTDQIHCSFLIHRVFCRKLEDNELLLIA